MGVGTAPEGNRSGHAAVYLGDVAALLKLVQVAADGILGHAKNLAQLVNADGLARDDILLYRIETADLSYSQLPHNNIRPVVSECIHNVFFSLSNL